MASAPTTRPKAIRSTCGRTRNIGYNAKSLEAYTTVLGWRLTNDITLRAEYSINDVGVVRGVTNAIRENAKDQDTYGVAIGVAF